jgi:hypothetical protein
VELLDLRQEVAEISQARVGMAEHGTKTTLVPGDYWLGVNAGEERRFGPVRIIRASRTYLPFTIVR